MRMHFFTRVKICDSIERKTVFFESEEEIIEYAQKAINTDGEYRMNTYGEKRDS